MRGGWLLAGAGLGGVGGGEAGLGVFTGAEVSPDPEAGGVAAGGG